MTVYAKPLSPEIVSQSDNTMVLSMGPQHPSTHGVLQIVLEIDGENVVKADPEIGYLHTGIEKTAEGLFWTQAQTVIERMDYLAPVLQRAVLRARSREAPRHYRSNSGASADDSRHGHGAYADRIALRLAWDPRHRPRRDLGVLLLLRPAREHPRSPRGQRRRAHAPELHARRRLQRRSSRRATWRSSTR